MLQFIGLQRVRQDLAIEQQQQKLLFSSRISSYSGGTERLYLVSQLIYSLDYYGKKTNTVFHGNDY